mmetsp:Transcript_30763/g.56930  ORF Transcript_30763/g.56930 Transcript_30763/m.56930 type:complete len:101 (-) Transcript_30763:472-774(-)
MSETQAGGGSTGGNNRRQVSDMDEHGEMKSDAIRIATEAVEKFVEEKAIANHVKRAFDAKHGPTWHVVAGSDFKAYATHESKTFFFFYVGKTAICMYKAG